jgi:hypothetical protein
MSSFLKILRNETGSILMALIATAIVSGLIFVFMNWQKLSLKSIKMAEEGVEFQMDYYSAADTLFHAYKQEEQRYFKSLSNCATVRPFIQALKEGSSCETEVEVFKPGTEGSASNLYQFVGGCKIEFDESDCGSGVSQVLKIAHTAGGGSLSPFRFYSFEFYIFVIIPEKSQIEFLIVSTDETNQNRIIGDKRKRTFALVDNVRNIAHIEADGRVTEENPSPTNRCGGKAWSDLMNFNPANLNCEKFSILGGAYGLAFYKDRFFGFRSDGQVFDLTASLTNEIIMVTEDGKREGIKVFPPYSKEVLFNINDITVIKETIYFVHGNGGDSKISAQVANGSNFDSRLICDLSAMGWSQSYDGILATSRSQDLIDLVNVGNTATFYLKSSGGDLITIMAVVDPSSSTGYTCYGYKDINLQEVEYKRTYGFDRTEENTSIYFY